MKAKRRPPQPDAPAMITRLHVQDRVIAAGAGAPRAWRKRTPFEAAFEQGKLGGGWKPSSAVEAD